MPPPRPAFPKQVTTTQSPPQAKPSLHEQTRGRTHPPSSKVQLTASQPEREGRIDARVTEPRESEVGRSEKQLWARLDELEREEEEYLAKEKEEEERAVATEAEKETAPSREGSATITTSDEGMADESMTTKAKDVSQTSIEPLTVTAAAPLRITVKHSSSSQPPASTEPQEVLCKCAGS